MSTAGILQIEIIAGVAKLAEDMKRAERVVGDTTSRMEKSVTSLQNQFSKLGMGLSFGLMIDQIRRLSDSFTKVTAQMRIATATQADYAKGMEEVRRISTAAQAGIEATTMLYTRLTNSLKQHGATQETVGRITESVSLGLKAYGATTAEAASAMLQLSQAFGSGRLGGEEFRAVSEAMPNMMAILAKSMEVPKSALRDLSMQGKITSEVMMKAWSNPAIIEALRAQAAMTRTITGEITVFRNELTFLVGEFMGASGSTAGITTAIRAMSDAVLFLGKHLDGIVFSLQIMSVVMAGKYAAAWVKSRLAVSAHAQELVMNAAGEKAHAAVVAASEAQQAAAKQLKIYAQREAFIATMAETKALLAGTLTAEARTAAELRMAAAIEAVNVANIQAIAEERARTTAMVASAAAEQARNAATLTMLGKIKAFAVSNALGLIGLALWGAYEIADHLGWIDSVFNRAEKNMKNLKALAGDNPMFDKAFQYMEEELAKYDARVAQVKAMKELGVNVGPTATTLQILAAIDRALLAAQRGAVLNSDRDRVEKQLLFLRKGYEASIQDEVEQKQVINDLTRDQMVMQNRMIALAKEFDDKDSKMTEAEYLAKVQEALYGKVEKGAEKAITRIKEERAASQTKIAIMQIEMDGTVSLTDAQQKLVELGYDYANGVDNMTAAEYARKAENLAGVAVMELQKRGLDELNAQLSEGTKAYNDYWTSVEQSTEKLLEQAKQQEWENSLIGKTKEEIAALTLLRENDAIVQGEATLATMLANDAKDEEIRKIGLQIEALYRLKGAREGKATAEATAESFKKETKQWEDMFKKVDDFARDAFLSIFDKGKNAFEEIGKVIKKSILEMLYKMTIQKWIFNVGTTAGGTMAAGAAAAATGSGAGDMSIGGLFNIGSSIFSGVTNGIASSVAQAGAFMWEAGAQTIGNAIMSNIAPITTALSGIGLALTAFSLLRGFGNRNPPAVSLGESSATFDALGNPIGGFTPARAGVLTSATSNQAVIDLQRSYAAIAASLGVQTSQATFQYGAGTHQSGGRTLVAGGAGGSWFGDTFVTSDEATRLAASRAVFAALKGSNLPTYLANMFNSLQPAHMTQEQLDGIIQFAGSVRQVREQLAETRAPMQVMNAQLSTALATLRTTAATYRTDFIAAIDAGITPEILNDWQMLGQYIQQASEYARQATDAFVSSIQAYNAAIARVGDELYRLRDASLSANEAVSGSQAAIRDAYFDAQERVNSLLRDAAQSTATFSGSISDFLNTMSDATSTQGLTSLKAQLSATSVLAAGGDIGARERIVREAQMVLRVGQQTSASSIEFARTQAFVRRELEAVQSAIAPTIAAATGIEDPLIAARAELDALRIAAGQAGVDLTQIPLDRAAELLADYNTAITTAQRATSDYNTAIGLTAGLIIPVNNALDPLREALETVTARSSDVYTSFQNAARDIPGFIDSIGNAFTAVIAGGSGRDGLTAFGTSIGLAGEQLGTFVTTILETLRTLAGQTATQGNTSISTAASVSPAVTAASVSPAVTAAPAEPMVKGYAVSALQNVIASHINTLSQASGATTADVIRQTRNALQQYGFTATDVGTIYGTTPDAVNAFFEAQGTMALPRFAIGTNYVPADMPAFVHEGERIIPRADNRELMQRLSSGNNDALVAEIRALRADNAEMRTELRRISDNTERTASTMNNVTRGGRAMQTEAFE